MTTKKSITLALLISALFTCLLGGCAGEEESSAVKTIPINFSADDKTILVNSFANLTDNEDLNLFEDGIANMLEESLLRMPGVKVIPRRSVNKFVAVGSVDETVTIKEVAKKKNANYVIDGWISKHDTNYRVYANLLDVETGKVDEKFAVTTFDNKEQAVLALNEFVDEIMAKVGNTTEEINQGLDYRYLDYDIFSLRLKAVSSYYRGRPDVAISLLEQALQLLAEREPKVAADSKKTKHYASGHIHYLLAQIHTELHNYDEAAEHLAVIIPFADSFGKLSQKAVEAMAFEAQGKFEQAKTIYTELVSEFPHQQFFYIRLADSTLLAGGSMEEAMEILQRGINLNPDETRLHREIARLQLQSNGEEEVESWVLGEIEKEKLAAGNELLNTLVAYRMRERVARSMPAEILTSEQKVAVEKAAEKVAQIHFGQVNIDLEKLRNNLDYNCPDTTRHAFKIANLAMSAGDEELARTIADLIREKGGAANSKDASNAIYSMLYASKGDMDTSREYMQHISGETYLKPYAIGNYLMHVGKYEKAAHLLEKALHMEGGKDPIIMHSIAYAHLLAGNYEKWDKYNKLYLEQTARMDLVSPTLKVKLENRWRPDRPPKHKENNR